nr:uncharacterized protein c30d11.14c [Quercus suber]
MEYDQQPPKRSRLDGADVAPVRKSRFDVKSRSRSPTGRGADENAAHRSRSPLKSVDDTAAAEKKRIAVEKAAAIALKLKKGLQHSDGPPVRKSPSVDTAATEASAEKKDVYEQDGDYIKDIEVNDLRNRYTLTKGSTQKMIKEETGADVTTRGSYYPDKSMATPANPLLYLHVTSTTKDGLERAVKMIEELMTQELPNLVDERRFGRRPPREEGPPVERDNYGRRKWPEEHIPIDLEPIPGFNLRAQVVGSGGSYVKWIQTETHCRVQIKGRGSGYFEHETGVESDQPMYLSIAGPEEDMIARAKEMCLELLSSVRDNYEQYKERRSNGQRFQGPPGGHADRGPRRDGSMQHGGSGQYGDSSQYGGPGQYGGPDQYGGNGGGYGGQQSPGAYGASYMHQPITGGYGGAQSPTDGAAAEGSPNSMTPEQYAAWCQYYAANPSLDPYTAYGGFAAFTAQYVIQPMPQSTPSYGYGGAPGAPPPPPADNVPPPPPPGL